MSDPVTLAAAISAAGAVGGGALTAITSKKSQGAPQLNDISNKQVEPNNDAAWRNAQDMARRRRGVAANMLTDGKGNTAGSVSTKTLLGQ